MCRELPDLQGEDMQVYLVQMTSRSDNERFYKVGCTRLKDVMLRFSRHEGTPLRDSDLSKKDKLVRAFSGHTFLHPYDVKELHAVEFLRDQDAELTEAEILEAVEPQQHWPRLNISGKSECFQADETQLHMVKEYMTDVGAKRNDHARLLSGQA
jgi:hypothetical protein